MNNEYIEFVKSRAKGGDAILLSLTPEKCHLLHMAIGISGEAAELLEAHVEEDAENVEEELGDLLFYLTGATFAFKEWNYPIEAPPLIEASNYPNLDIADAVVAAAGNFLDLVKKYTVYNKPFDEIALSGALAIVLNEIEIFATVFELNIPDLVNENMTKLLKRYANGYSDKAAQERADKPAGE